MKKPREEQTKIDLTTLIDPDTLITEDENDCFGKEWDPQDKDCALCHDVEICGILHQKTTHARVKKLEKEKGPFLDMTAFELVPEQKIVENITAYAEEGDPATLDEIYATIMSKARTKDKVAVREYLKRMLPKYGLIITPKKTVIPNEKSTDSDKRKYPLTPEESTVRSPEV